MTIFYYELPNDARIESFRDIEDEGYIKYFPEDTTGYYVINSISCVINDLEMGLNVILSYTFYDSKNNELRLFNYSKTRLAEVMFLTNINDYEKAKIELIDYGKSIAKYMKLKFIIYDIKASFEQNGTRFRCCNCGNLIPHEPKSELILSRFQINKLDYKLNKAKYEHLRGLEIGQINRGITLIINNYNKEIREDFYCIDCIKNIKSQYVDIILTHIQTELDRYNKTRKESIK